MRVHLLAVPNAPTIAASCLDGFAQRTILFAELLKRLKHEVILYGHEENEAPCDQFVKCLTKTEREGFLGGIPYQSCPFEPGSTLFLTFNTRAGQHLKTIREPGDVLATIGGSAQAFVWEQNPDLTFLEYSIGYRGVIAPNRVYQSQAWRHTVSGYTGVDGGRDGDTVIPPWFHATDFDYTTHPERYVLYVGRIVPGKGLRIVCEAAKQAGVPLIVIGHGDPALVTYGEYRGAVTTEERNHLLTHASAVLMPTQYLEPFGNVSAEAQLCGTPVISTDYGAFTESVEHGRTGYRCASLGEFVQAIEQAPDLDRLAIRIRAQRLYSMDAAAQSYSRYFTRLMDPEGWRSLAPTLAVPELAYT